MLGECSVQTDHLLVSVQQAQMSVLASVSPGAHMVTQLVDRVKYVLYPGCHGWSRTVSLPNGEAQLAGCLKGLAGGLLQWDLSIQ